MEQKVRYHLLDFIRGICILLVVGYHILFDLSEVFGGAYPFFRSTAMTNFRHCFVGTLVILAGISCSFTRSNIKRGIKILFWGMVITGVTTFLMPSQQITFGILHFFGTAMLLYGVLEKPIGKIPTIPGLLLNIILLLVTWNIYRGILGIPGWLTLELPEIGHHFPLFVLGFRTGHSSGDYYPLMPWLFLFFIGVFLGRYFKAGSVPAVFRKNPIPVLATIGRNTLWIYLIHQPVVYGLLYLWFTLLH